MKHNSNDPLTIAALGLLAGAAYLTRLADLAGWTAALGRGLTGSRASALLFCFILLTALLAGLFAWGYRVYSAKVTQPREMKQLLNKLALERKLRRHRSRSVSLC